MITREDVEHISWLASINIKEDEMDEFVRQFNSILEYFHQLDEIDTESVKPIYRVVDLVNVFREDQELRSLSQEESLRNAPLKENGHFRSPRIV